VSGTNSTPSNFLDEGGAPYPDSPIKIYPETMESGVNPGGVSAGDLTPKAGPSNLEHQPYNLLDNFNIPNHTNKIKNEIGAETEIANLMLEYGKNTNKDGFHLSKIQGHLIDESEQIFFNKLIDSPGLD